MANPSKEEKCCICQEENFILPFQSNCSHWFCGGCFLELWNRRPAFEFKPCKCPLDSGFITSLRPTELALVQQRSFAECHQRSQVLEFIGYYNSLFDEGSFRFMQLLRGFPLIRQKLEKAQGLRRPISRLLWVEVIAYWLWRFPFLNRRLTMERRPLPLLFWADIIVHIIACAVYIRASTDALPEKLFGLVGYVDDFLIVVLAFLRLARKYYLN